MKKLVVAIAVLFLLAVPVGSSFGATFGLVGCVPSEDGKALEIINWFVAKFTGYFGGTINGTPLEFNDADNIDGYGFIRISKNGDILSDDEIRMVGLGIEAIIPDMKRGKLQTPEMDFEIEAKGKSLLVTVKSRRNGAVFQGKFEGIVEIETGIARQLSRDEQFREKSEMEKHFLEFKTDADGYVIANGDALPSDLNKMIIDALNFAAKSIARARLLLYGNAD